MNRKRENEWSPYEGRSETIADSVDGELNLSAYDEQVRTLLRQWIAPDVPGSLDEQVLAVYRRQVACPPLWKRMFTSSLRVPVPVAAAVALILIASGLLALRTQPAPVFEAPPPTERTRIVEVPVVQEKIVTRTVYVEKKRRRYSLTRNQYLAKNRERVGSDAEETEDASLYFTHSNLAGFEPVREMKIQIIRRADANEN